MCDFYFLCYYFYFSQVEKYRTQAEKYTENVKEIFDETKELQSMLELVDSLRKLGLAHKFEKEIKKALDTVASTENSNPLIGTDLYLTSLYFRLLRQHGYQVSQGIEKWKLITNHIISVIPCSFSALKHRYFL